MFFEDGINTEDYLFYFFEAVNHIHLFAKLMRLLWLLAKHFKRYNMPSWI